MKKWAKDLNTHFSKNNIQMFIKHMKKCSASLVTGEVYIRNTVRYHFTSTRMAIIKNTNNSVCLRMRRNWDPHLLLVGE